jgi:hypothetical protein
MLKLICLLCVFSTANCLAILPHRLSIKYANGEQFMQIRLHGTLIIPLDMHSGTPITGLSGLTWEANQQLLYAVTDKGLLYVFKPTLENHTLTDIALLKTIPLLNQYQGKLKPRYADSEGLTSIPATVSQTGNTELLVSFEQIPRLTRYTLDGTWLDEITLPETLSYPSDYRHNNRMLESVVLHPRFGILTAPERPLVTTDVHLLKIYAMDGNTWQTSHYMADKSSVTGMEVFEDGSLLILERAFTGITEPLLISLRRVWLNKGCENNQTLCKTQQLAVFDTNQGWDIDNFEGLAHHQGNFFWMISDDNQNFFQKTLLSYFEVMD